MGARMGLPAEWDVVERMAGTEGALLKKDEETAAELLKRVQDLVNATFWGWGGHGARTRTRDRGTEPVAKGLQVMSVIYVQNAEVFVNYRARRAEIAGVMKPDMPCLGMFSIVTIPRRLKSAPVLWPLAVSEEAAIPHVTCECVILAAASDATRKRAEKYQWLFPIQEDGKLGPVAFDDKDFPVSTCGPLSVLLRTLNSYAVAPGASLQQLCIAVPDFLSEQELAVVQDAVNLADLVASAHLLRHSDAVAAAFAHSQGSSLLPEGTEERVVGFVDIGSSHGTVSVVRFARKEAAPEEASSPLAAGVSCEFLYRCSEEELGVQSLMSALLQEAISRIEKKHNCKVKLGTKAGVRLANEAIHALKQLSMLPDAEMGLEAFMPEGPEGPEIDVSVPLTRAAFEAAAASVLTRLKEVLAAAAATSSLEAVELVGGGGRIPAVQKLVKDAVGESVPLRFGLDGASCVATGAAAWAAGRRPVAAMDAPMGVGGLDADELARVRAHEAEIEAINSEEVRRLEKRNTLESYVYQVRDWMNGKDGSLLNPSELNPFLDKVVLWFEDADMAEEPTSYQTYADKLQE
ncbi:SSE1, partial [Symbiodinium necroappetens]